MSLILEALNKAEKHQDCATNYSAPQPYPIENQTHTKWPFFALIATVCIASTIITWLIFNSLSSSSEPTQATLESTVDPTTTLQPSIQSTEQNQTSKTSYSKQANTTPINHAVIATPALPNSGTHNNKAIPDNNSITEYREPSLRHLVKSASRNENRRLQPEKDDISKTTSGHKKENSNKAAAKPIISGIGSKAETAGDSQKIKHISAATNLKIKDIEISVHMYSEIPAKRFVYINSTRYGEGSQINDNLSIDEITRNGIIFNSYNTLYRLPLKP